VSRHCTPADPHPVATLQQRALLSMSSVHAADDSEVELLCLDHMSLVPLRPLPQPRSFDSELPYLYPQTADKLSAVPVIKTPQLSTQVGRSVMISNRSLFKHCLTTMHLQANHYQPTNYHININ